MELLLIHEILFCLANLPIYLFKYSLHFFTNNGKYLRQKCGRVGLQCFITLTALRNFMEISYKV